MRHISKACPELNNWLKEIVTGEKEMLKYYLSGKSGHFRKDCPDNNNTPASPPVKTPKKDNNVKPKLFMGVASMRMRMMARS